MPDENPIVAELNAIERDMLYLRGGLGEGLSRGLRDLVRYVAPSPTCLPLTLAARARIATHAGASNTHSKQRLTFATRLRGNNAVQQ
jgi:hypothetical protein